MANKKLKLLFDARALHAGAHKTSSRSGIYFTALNLLKSMMKNKDIEITLYYTEKEKRDVTTVLQQEFPNIKFNILNINNFSSDERLETVFYILNQDKCPVKKFFTNIFYKFYNNVSLFLCQTKLFKQYYSTDVIFSPAFMIPEPFNILPHAKKYIMLHDIMPIILEKYYEHNSGNDWFFKMIDSINGKDYYFTNSENTKNDYIKHIPQINPEKIHTVYLGCNINYLPSQSDLDKVKTKYNIPKDKKYLFSLCSLEPRKNLIRMIKTFLKFIEKNNIDDLILVMGGGGWESFQIKMSKELANINTDKIHKIGYVDDEDLQVLYSGAEWFTYTSQYEGFGLPVLEAMYCGCPVITSNNSSLPEVIGDAGIKIDWDSDEQHIQAYEQYYYNENLRKENSRKGREQAQKFSWDKTVNKIIDVITCTVNNN